MTLVPVAVAVAFAALVVGTDVASDGPPDQAAGVGALGLGLPALWAVTGGGLSGLGVPGAAWLTVGAAVLGGAGWWLAGHGVRTPAVLTGTLFALTFAIPSGGVEGGWAYPGVFFLWYVAGWPVVLLSLAALGAVETRVRTVDGPALLSRPGPAASLVCAVCGLALAAGVVAATAPRIDLLGWLAGAVAGAGVGAAIGWVAAR